MAIRFSPYRNRLSYRPWSNVVRNNIHIYIICLTCFLIVAATEPERFVRDNEFNSSSPKLQVKVDSKLKYLGQLDYTVEQESPDRVRLVSYETKSYVFAGSIDTILKKAVYIQIRREQTKYVGNLLGDAKANVKSGLCSLGGEEYTCFTRLIFLSPSEPIAKFISEQGYGLPACVMARTYARVDSTMGNYLVVMTYLENLPPVGLSCESWLVENQLTTEHAQYIELFDSNCKASFTIIKKESNKPGIRRLLGG